MSKPKATQRTRDRYRLGIHLDKHGNRIKEHVGRDIVRSAFCPKHGRWSETFEAANDNGWIFRCKGERGATESAHTFAAEPA